MHHRITNLRSVVVWLTSIAFLPTIAFAAEPAAKKPAGDAAPNWAAIFQMHYTQRVQEFRQQNQMLQNVILVGDSITEGFDVSKWFPDRRILNRGIGADVIGNSLPAEDKRGVLKRLDESFFDLAARDAFVMIGINDLGAGHTPDQVEAGYRTLLDRVKRVSPRLRVHVQSILPTRDEYAKHNANVVDCNKRLRKLAEEFGYEYLDLHSLMTDDKGDLRRELTADGLHINAAGYAIWRTEIDKVMGWGQSEP